MNTIIEKIRAKVNRLKPRIRKICGEEVKIPVEKVREKFDTLLSFLSDLEKEEKPMNPQPVKIDIRKELASIEFMGVNDARDTETIARHFYALGQQSKEQPVCEDAEMEIKETELEYQQRSERGEYPVNIESICRRFYELGRQSKQTEWTEEDIKNGSYISAFLQANCGDSVILKRATIWFMSRLKQLPIQQSKLEVCEGLEDVADTLAEEHGFVKKPDFKPAKYSWSAVRDVFIEGVLAGAKWQKEQDEKGLSEKIASAYQLGLADKEKQEEAK